MSTAAELIRRAREGYSRDEPRDSTSSSDRQYTRGATGTPTGGQFAKTAGTAQAKPKPTGKPVAKKPAAKPAAKKPATTLDQAMGRQYADFGSVSERTPAGDQRIKDMQALMAGLGIKVAQDGKFGPEMTAAVKALQAKVGSKPTGRATSSLFKKLQSAAILSPCARASEGVLLGAADLLRRAREGYNPDQLRAKRGTGIGGRWVSMGAVVAALKGKGHNDAAASLGHLDTPAGGRHVPTHRPASHTPKIAHGGDRVKADRLHAEIGRLDEQHGARLHAGSAMLDPEARRQNRLQAERLRSELAPVQARLDTEAAIKADNLETQGLIGDVPEGDHLAAARAHVAGMQGGAPVATPLSSDPGVRAVQVENRIRQAYERTATPRGPGSTGGWTNMTRLRGELGDIPREEVDSALDRMIEDPDVTMHHELNQRVLTAADRAAAVDIGGEPRHNLKIGDPAQRPLPAVASMQGGKPDPQAPGVPPAAAKMARAKAAIPGVPAKTTPTERRKQQRVDMLDKAIDAAASDPELSRVQVDGDRSVVDQLRRIRGSIAEGRQGDEATVQDLNNVVQHREMSDEGRRIMSDLIDEHARLAAEHRVPEPRPGAAAKMARAKAATPDPAETVAKLRGATSRDEARVSLAGLSATDLRAVAVEAGIPHGARDTKPKLTASIVDVLVGGRLNHAAIMRGGSGPISPGAPDTRSPVMKLQDAGASPDEIRQAVIASQISALRDQFKAEGSSPAKPTAAKKMTRAKAAVPFSAPDVAATMRRLGNEDAIAQELQRVKATDLRALADEFNISFPAQVKSGTARKIYLARTLAEYQRRNSGI